ncbi:MAG: agmatinase family protein [Bacteroidales bacterium]
MNDFNPNDIGVANGNYFGLPYSVNDSEIVLISVPWDVTTSYCAGTSNGPQAIIDASVQVDLFDQVVPQAWEVKIGTVPVDKNVIKHNKVARKIAEEVIETLACGEKYRSVEKQTAQVNEASVQINGYVNGLSEEYLKNGKFVGVVGGEHSVPLGLIKALGEKYDDFGILHIDAHADLRNAYEGFTYSHASIMFNVLKEVPAVSRITQVAVRDFCSDEYAIMREQGGRVCSFTDTDLCRDKFEGHSWMEICDKIIATLPRNVYVSFDIDGLSPELCPNTGTPVPGGLSYREADYLLERLVKSDRKMIGFDLCEVAPSLDGEREWDANVGARVLFKLSLYAKKSLNK